MADKWQGKVVVITGAANGIGAAVVKLALEEGVKHVAILDQNDSAGIALQNELNSKYGLSKIQFYRVDVTSDDQLFEAFQSVLEGQGTIDVVINNAGIMNDAPHVYKKEIAINVTAVVTSTLKAMEIMRVDKGGKGGTIMNISSVNALKQSSFMPIYFGTKAAVLHFSSCIGKQYNFGRTSVRVLTVCIGGTETSLCLANNLGSHDKNITPEQMYRNVVARTPLQKVESAAKGVIEAYKMGKNGGTFIATRDRPARDITDNITKGYEIMREFN